MSEKNIKKFSVMVVNDEDDIRDVIASDES